MLNNNIKILLVSFVHHIELQNFLNTPPSVLRNANTKYDALFIRIRVLNNSRNNI